MKKRIFSLVIALVFYLSLSGCAQLMLAGGGYLVPVASVAAVNVFHKRQVSKCYDIEKQAEDEKWPASKLNRELKLKKCHLSSAEDLNDITNRIIMQVEAKKG
ncbi:MAG: hypothetical protein R3B60_01105 [Candidatus Paceibacterota bacterium]